MNRGAKPIAAFLAVALVPLVIVGSIAIRAAEGRLSPATTVRAVAVTIGLTALAAVVLSRRLARREPPPIAESSAPPVPSTDEPAQSSRGIDEFAEIAAHDLKEPVRGIRQHAATILDEHAAQLDAEGRRRLESIVALTTRLDSLINALLEFSRVARQKLTIRDVDMNEVLEDVLVTLRPLLTERGVEVRVPSPLPRARCDAVRVGEVLCNLISNGAKYNDKSARFVAVGHESGVFWVSDNGIGIEKKFFDAIFHIFRRLHARDAFCGGTGVGLTFVRQIVERHGGKVWVESTPGSGSTFCFTLDPQTPAIRPTRAAVPGDVNLREADGERAVNG